jgi:C4-dicarboxylate-specific signal transduction histidine kinase
VVLRVEDNGPGFLPHVLDRPLEAFFTTKDADAGTGLGLSICHTIAREHAGKLEFGNNAAGGAYVELHLPERSP